MVKCHARTHVGLKRRHNEDSLLALEHLGLFVVADGVGGRKAGEIASAFAVETFQKEGPRLKQAIDTHTAQPNRDTRNDVLRLLEEITNDASKRIYESATATGRQGMTTTLVAALIGGGSAFIVHVGDSRAYLVRDGQLRQLTEDHSLLNYMIRSGAVKSHQNVPQNKNVITRAVGLYPTVRPDTLHIELLEGDRLLLCSDGLTDMAEHDAVLELIARPNLMAAVDGLIQEALDKGGKDNVTVIAIEPEAMLEAETVSARAKAMENLFLFADLPFHARLRVGRIVSERYVTPNDVVVRQGEVGDTLFVVVKGRFIVRVDGQELAVLTEGEHFGELALVDDQPRSADIVSEGYGHLLAIERNALREYCAIEPPIGNMLLWKLVATLGQRLRITNQQAQGKP